VLRGEMSQREELLKGAFPRVAAVAPGGCSAEPWRRTLKC
jgi:hypothetical protein